MIRQSVFNILGLMCGSVLLMSAHWWPNYFDKHTVGPIWRLMSGRERGRTMPYQQLISQSSYYLQVCMCSSVPPSLPLAV